MKNHLAASAGSLGPYTLEILATIAEERQLQEVISVVQDMVVERMRTALHIERSRKQKLTRQDVMETRNRPKERTPERSQEDLGSEDEEDMSGGRKRKRPAFTMSLRKHSKNDTRPARHSVTSPAESPTPGARYNSNSSRGGANGAKTGNVSYSIDAS